MGRKQRPLFDQGEVDADIERGDLPRQPCRVIESPADGHDGGRGEHAAAMRLENAVVDPRGQAEVVRVDDQSGRDMTSEGRRTPSPTVSLTMNRGRWRTCSSTRARYSPRIPIRMNRTPESSPCNATMVAHPGTASRATYFDHRAFTSAPKEITLVMRPITAPARRGTVEKDVMPCQASRNIRRTVYLLVPA